ncbi:right-handed parallel beta-helix repeat-containing protein [candidate division KSB1 bacterium]
MSKIKVCILFTTALFLSLSCPYQEKLLQRPGIYYISPEGNDEWSGMRSKPNWDDTDGPFATLEKAKEVIRELKKSGKYPIDGVSVNIKGGIYSILKTFGLEKEDSGKPNAPVVYRPYENEDVMIIGALSITGFRKVSDPEILRYFDRQNRDKIYFTNLPLLGIRNFGEIKKRGFGRPIMTAALELFFQDKAMTPARWPNSGWTKIVDTPAGKDGGKFTYEGNRPHRWTFSSDIFLHGYWTWDWADSYEKVKSIDLNKREITTYAPHGVYGYSPGKRFYAFNILEELDQPGEWYLDRKTGNLYFWPPGDPTESFAFVSLMQDPFIKMNGVSYVNFENITFKYTRGSAVEINGGNGCVIKGCTFKNIGTYAVSIDSGLNNGVQSCDISDCGEGGIILKGGIRKTLAPGRNFAINNHIYNYSNWVRTYRPGVHVHGVGNIVANNLIHSAPHMAIGLHGNDHIIEYNEIRNVCNETSDVGAFYMGRDWTQRGNIVRYNYFHHLGSIGEGVGTMAVYLDDWTSGTTVFGNICYKAGRSVLIGGGRDNTVENNIFIDCTPSVHVDSRGLGWAKYYFDGTNTTLIDRMNAVNYREPPYSTRYPELLTLYDDEPAVAKGNKIIRNISFGGRWLDLRNGLNEQIVHLKDNLINVNPKFENFEKEDYRLKKDSPALNLGFQQIPVEKIGLYIDKYRTELPENR